MLWQEGPGYKSTERGCRWEADVGMSQGLLQRLRPTFWDAGLFCCRMLMGRTVPRHGGSPSCHPRLLTLPLRTKSSFPYILASLEDMSVLPALSSAPAASPCLFMSLDSLTLSLSQTFCLPPPPQVFASPLLGPGCFPRLLPLPSMLGYICQSA